MSVPVRRLLPILIVLGVLGMYVILAQGDDTGASAVFKPTPTLQATAPALTPSPPANQAAAATPTPLPPSPVVATPTQPPPPLSTPTAATQSALVATGPLQFKPDQLVQGQASVVSFTQPATAATLSFGGKQYPMLQSGDRWWAVIGVGAFVSPGLYPVTVLYTPPSGGAPVSVTASIIVVRQAYGVERIDLPPGTASLLAPETVQNEINVRAAIFSGYTTRRMWNGVFQAPVRGAKISDTYGTGRSWNGAPVTDYHRGVDFEGDTGTPILAAADGRVAFAGELAVRGNSVILDHGAGVFTGYHHLSTMAVALGQDVRAGQPLGAMGSTGLATGPHLHWEVIVRGTEVDGQQWLRSDLGP